MSKKPHGPRIVLHKPATAAAILALAKAVVQAVTANKGQFPIPSPPLAVLTADVDALDTAETATKTRTKGAVQTRDAKLAVVITDLGLLRAYVQSIADAADSANAVSIAHAAGMAVRKSSAFTKPDFGAKPDKVLSGVVRVSVRVAGKRQTHLWQFSTDGKTWIDMPPTMQGKTTASGFTPGSTIYFRHRAITRAGLEDWSQPISVMAH